ncbi:MAG: Multi-sensor signal transduction histidine kinase [Parcubacteria group bacterium GW2011_GWC1_43_30]|nr:MAG: Multi-sensor signal transduction histidine kinase [Parcubacteria group bacterium GW2011_GWC1_43_30]
MTTVTTIGILVLVGLIAIFAIGLSVYFVFKNYKAKGILEKRERDISRRMYELAILKELGDRIGYSLDVQQIIDIIINSLHQFIDYSAVSYMLLGPEKLIFKMHLERSVHQRFVIDIKDRMLNSLSALLDREFNKKNVKEIISGAIIIEELYEPVRSFFNIPLVIDEKVVGVLTVADTKIGLYKEEEMTILYKIIQQASKAVTSLQGVVKTEQAKVNAMVESMADGVVMTDIDYRIMVINPSARAIIGLPKKENVTIFDFIDNLEGKFDIRGKLEESVKLNKPFKSEEVLIRDKFYKIFVFPVKTNVIRGIDEKDAVGGVVIFHDVTAEKSIEQIREQFTSMIVHELRTPLSGINKISELLRGGPEKIKKEDFDEYIRLINVDSNGMLELVNDILDIAKLEAGKFDVKKEPVDIKKVIDNRAEFFKPSALDAKLAIRVAYDTELPTLVPIDQAGIKQVLNNLISNALKFTKANGSVEILIVRHKKGIKINDEFARLPTKTALSLPEDKFVNMPESVVVAISDTGAGIDAGEIKELFNKFKQLNTKSETGIKGTGLGLAIVKGIVEGHGGSVGVVSEIGIGSVFFFVLPLN